MSDIVIVALITVIGSLLTLFINRWFKKMDGKLDKYHRAVNGKMDKLLEVSNAAKKAEGNKEGREELVQEQKKEDIDNKTD